MGLSHHSYSQRRWEHPEQLGRLTTAGFPKPSCSRREESNASESPSKSKSLCSLSACPALPPHPISLLTSTHRASPNPVQGAGLSPLQTHLPPSEFQMLCRAPKPGSIAALTQDARAAKEQGGNEAFRDRSAFIPSLRTPSGNQAPPCRRGLPVHLIRRWLFFFFFNSPLFRLLA